MDWFKKHTDTVLILSAIFSSFLWMNGQFNDIRKDMASLKEEVFIMKTVLIMRGIMPQALAQTPQPPKQDS